MLFDHHVAFTQARAYKRIQRCMHPMFICNYHWFREGYCMTAIKKLFNEKYKVNVETEDIDILKSRVYFVQNHEERRGVCFHYGT